MKSHLRIARPVGDLTRSKTMYCAGLGLRVIGGFEDHEGFDGVMLGRAGLDHHFEFTVCRTHPVKPNPTAEDLIVFYLPDATVWRSVCADMSAAGFVPVRSFNPYWDANGKTFEDPDGYRIVLQNALWVNTELHYEILAGMDAAELHLSPEDRSELVTLRDKANGK